MGERREGEKRMEDRERSMKKERGREIQRERETITHKGRNSTNERYIESERD